MVAVFSFCGIGGDWTGVNRKLSNLWSLGIVDGALNDEVNVRPVVSRQTEIRRDVSGNGMIVSC